MKEAESGTLDLNRHRSVWLGTTSDRHFPALSSDLRVDVAVLGGGITGLTTALLLKQRGATVAVLDRHQVASGTTGHTTGKITSLHALAYARLVSEHGEHKARLYGEANQAAIEQIARLVERLGIDCDFERGEAYAYTLSDEHAAEIKAEVDAATRLGLPAFYTTETDLPYPIRAGIRFDRQARFHPGEGY